MENWISFFYENGGLVFAALGMATATICGGIGSTIGVGMTSQAAAGLISEQPEKFGQALILELLSATQGLYGFVISFMIYLQITGDISFQKGLFLFVAALPISITAIANGVWQGRGASAAMQILAKKPEHTTKGIIFVAMMETYAILGFVISFLLVMM
ncbi:V-type ATP synthase subunit K [Enterococcus aquimarinus]|jgi:V/A-type H+-transporting ATPase subunit K|uniref:V-type ATP synthase subunit K n=1 Tax=Enterococcus aquimarinus TaxID=328396 RepID=A0A1L8QSJ0_9ENTE|nr:V-type ATP synthase subunit K [Enterococcus aquimarinus]MBP7953307.1 V-type ATP synthase subunit K [Enterococcus sp.]MBP8693824.1 V-type ATP synthase subunit K [Enterococcus sp.]MBP9521611.1 V-type ATP synthase subunit K [Enterococcus sp.]MBP9639028.1 V-type ATP synthase subunit K [Enterococcus sp.]MCC9272881.1 V-type ATP synthase subunit K [Enterococcus aquimarinus]